MDTVGAVDAGEFLRFLELSRIEMGIDDNEIDAELIVAFLSGGSVGNGDHKGGALLPGRIVLIALKETA